MRVQKIYRAMEEGRDDVAIAEFHRASARVEQVIAALPVSSGLYPVVRFECATSQWLYVVLVKREFESRGFTVHVNDINILTICGGKGVGFKQLEIEEVYIPTTLWEKFRFWWSNLQWRKTQPVRQLVIR